MNQSSSPSSLLFNPPWTVIACALPILVTFWLLAGAAFLEDSSILAFPQFVAVTSMILALAAIAGFSLWGLSRFFDSKRPFRFFFLMSLLLVAGVSWTSEFLLR